jgi:hypothetical protein
MKGYTTDYFSALMDCKVILEFLMRHLGIGRYGKKEFALLMREAAKELLVSRSHRNTRVVKR